MSSTLRDPLLLSRLKVLEVIIVGFLAIKELPMLKRRLEEMERLVAQLPTARDPALADEWRKKLARYWEM